MQRAELEALAQYAPDRPILLWTDFPPTAGGGGAVIFRSLLGPRDLEKVVWVSPAKADGKASASRAAYLTTGSAGKGRRSLFLDSTWYADALADETLRLAEQYRARAVWVVLHGAGVPVAAALADRAHLPLHVTVHDDPAFATALRSRRYAVLTPWIERCFARALRGATSIDVVSEGMVARYQRRYGVASTVVHRAMRGPIAPSAPYDPAVHGLRVAMLGNTYAYDQLPVLGRAVAKAAETLGVPGRITVLGRGQGDRLRADLAGVSGVDVEVLGHVDEPEAARKLAQCFLLYLSYPFGPSGAVLRTTSFPTKLTTYLLAARPLLVHAPKDTVLGPVVARSGYAFGWPSMSVDDGVRVLLDAWRGGRAFTSAHAEAEATRARHYDYDTNRRALFTTLDALVPPLESAARAPERSARVPRGEP